VFSREHAGELHFGDARFDIGEEPFDLCQGRLIATLFAEFGEHAQIVEFVPRRLAAIDDLLAGGAFAQQILRLIPTVPESGLGKFGFEFSYPFLLAGNVKETSSAHRACS